MTPDINTKDFYLSFISSAKEDVEIYTKELENTILTRDNLYEQINENKLYLKVYFGLDLDKYEIEWKNKSYNENLNLYKAAYRIYRDSREQSYRYVIINIIKYCIALQNIDRYTKLIALCDKRSSIKFAEYRKIISTYYMEIHKCILQGYGYKFKFGIGTYILYYYKIKSKKPRVKLNYRDTAIRKKELLEQGVKLYDEKEAAWYAERNIPYSGIDYRVFSKVDGYYIFTFVNSKISKKTRYEYKRNEYVPKKYRGISYKYIAENMIKKEEDIYNLQIDIKYKLNILLHLYPHKFMNFVRGEDYGK